MSLTFESTHAIASPPARVFAAMTDLEQMRQWMPGLVRLEPLTEGPYRVGFEFRETRRIMGREGAEVFRVDALEPDRALTFYVDGKRGSTGRGEYHYRYTLTPEGDGTRLTFHAEMGGMGWFGELMGRLFLGMFKKAVAKDHEALQRFVETGARPAA